jgi:cystathionine beta-lyase
VSFNFDQVIDRCCTDSVKWLRYGDEVLALWVADMDFRTPDAVVQALHERVDHGIFGYCSPPEELREVIQERLSHLYDWQVQADEIFYIPGVVSGFNLACKAIGGEGDGVLVQPPIYPPMLTAPGNAGQILTNVPLVEGERRYEIDFDAFEAAITPRTSMFLLCNPHNPTGRVLKRWELERLAEICLRHDVVICSDEIHCDVVYTGHRHIPIASLDKEVAAQTFTLFAPSKTFNIPGLKCSVGVIQNPELRKRVDQAAAGIIHGVNVLGYTAALAAYRDGGPWLDALRDYLEQNRDYLVDYVAGHLPGVTCKSPEGTFLAWLDCRDAGIPGDPMEFFLENAHVALNDGARFGEGGSNFVRLNFGCPRATLTRALDQMREALGSLQ